MKYLNYFFICFPVLLFSQPGQDWYDKNDRGDHYEGSYTRKVSNPSISLVSLTGNLPAYDFGQRQKLQVKFYNPKKYSYNLHAEELRVSQFYWMEDKNNKSPEGWNTFDNWQVDYFLKRLSIDHRNLGILIRLGGKGNRTYSPALVQLNNQNNNPRFYIAQLRLGRPASGGSFSLYRGKSRSSNKLLKNQAITKKASGTVFPVVLPLKDLGMEADWFTVEVNLREERTGDPFTYSFSFYHPGKL